MAFPPTAVGVFRVPERRGARVKVRASTKKMCDNCRLIRRRRRVWVVCSNPRHRQRQG